MKGQQKSKLVWALLSNLVNERKRMKPLERASTKRSKHIRLCHFVSGHFVPYWISPPVQQCSNQITTGWVRNHSLVHPFSALHNKHSAVHSWTIYEPVGPCAQTYERPPVVPPEEHKPRLKATQMGFVVVLCLQLCIFLMFRTTLCLVVFIFYLFLIVLLLSVVLCI